MTDTRESPAPSRAPLEQREEVSAQLAELEYLLREDPSPKRRRAAVLECAAALRAAYPDEWAAALAPVESGTPEPVAWRYQTFGSIRWQFTDDHAAIPRNCWRVEALAPVAPETREPERCGEEASLVNTSCDLPKGHDGVHRSEWEHDGQRAFMEWNNIPAPFLPGEAEVTTARPAEGFAAPLDAGEPERAAKADPKAHSKTRDEDSRALESVEPSAPRPSLYHRTSAEYTIGPEPRPSPLAEPKDIVWAFKVLAHNFPKSRLGEINIGAAALYLDEAAALLRAPEGLEPVWCISPGNNAFKQMESG